MSFKPGSLYKIKHLEFPFFRGSTNFYFKESESENFSEDSLIFVVEPLFLMRTKLRSSPGREPTRYSYWCVKVMINDRVGYVNMWEDEWEEIT